MTVQIIIYTLRFPAEFHLILRAGNTGEISRAFVRACVCVRACVRACVHVRVLGIIRVLKNWLSIKLLGGFTNKEETDAKRC